MVAFVERSWPPRSFDPILFCDILNVDIPFHRDTERIFYQFADVYNCEVSLKDMTE